ncbi:MAG: acetaldehyde dehydrogenase (acetylating) [Elusimicrobia bacterium RIFOXYC2_FULL_34_12]|nr:MAG: acetaldehyde dehydrogenase (acetylating) [Elusimicrobia bacterium RIFOXYC2_FULL_34_12]HAM37806.1 acetaldehyde dehydrogenase (acetylating) [Elusimicrobiota bacterium]
MKKVKVGIIGTGNIGTDLLVKIQRSEILECGIFAGRSSDSNGIRKAEQLGVTTSCDSIKYIQNNPDCCEIVFDATSSKIHLYNAPILKSLKKYTIDLTPSQVGKMCVPAINMAECLNSDNINLVTCGGQATIPIVYAIMKVHPEIEYVEIVASISSKSAGPGTRANIDEFTQTTRDAITEFTGVKRAKAIIVLNPAEPPVLMHNTIYAKMENPNIERLHIEIMAMAKKIQKYVPGFKITLGPVAENNRVTTMVEVVGLGDFLPKYSGNLDIITCAAVNMAEEYAKKKIL